MDWLNVIKSFAPTVASAVAGPLGGVVVAGLGKVFGLEESTVESVGKAITAGKMTPEQMLEVKKMEADLKKQEAEMGFKYADLEFRDRDSARKMQIETRSHMPAALTILTTVGFFGVLGAMFYHPDIKESAPLMIMLGQLSAGWASALAFWLGTTHSSKAKTDMLANRETRL